MEITTFFYKSNRVRTIIDENGNPWWVGRDVCDILGYANPNDVMSRHLKPKHRRVSGIQTPLAGAQQMVCISESGLYRLITRSEQAEAEPFQDWVYEEVLPSIRKTGSYSIQPQIPQSFAEALQLAADQARQIEEQRPKVEFVGRYVDSSGFITLTESAKTIDFKRKDLIECLERDGLLFRRRGRLEPYKTAVDRGLFVVKTGEANGHSYNQVYLTPKGLEWVSQTYRSELAAS